MPEVSKNEYQAKKREQEKYKREKAVCEDKISTLDDEIAVLDTAISRMTDAYDYYKEKTIALKKQVGKNNRFKGNQYDKLIGGTGTALADKAQRLQMDSVNSVLDQLEWLRQQKISERNEQYGILGKIVSGLRYVGTWLNTHFFNN